MSILTRCPHCQTCFRVTDEQLGMAGGKVRCGHCMGVFNARDARVAEKPSAAEPTAAGKTRRESSAPRKPERAAESPRTPTDKTEPQPKSEPDPDEDGDLLFADNPEEDETEEGYTGTQKVLEGDELSDSFLALDEQRDQPDDLLDETREEPVDESWAEQILNEEARPPKSAEKQTAEPERPSPRRTAEPEPAPEAESESDETPLTAEPGSRIDEVEQRPAYHELRPEPLAAETKGKRGIRRRLFWTVAILGLLAVIISQLTYFQFDRLSRVEMLRPLYEVGCRWAGCTLPQLVDVTKIKSEKLVVRSDPDNPSLLVVDAIIVNQASYDQPFPAIALTFANLNNDVVAQRVFHPDEYLKGDARGMKDMPSQTPFRIELRIKDPGQDAVNYNIEFLPEQPAGSAGQ